MPNLTVKSIDARVEVFCIKFRHMTSNSFCHSIDLEITLTDVFHGVSIVLNFDLLYSD